MQDIERRVTMNKPDVYRKLSYLYMELAFHEQSFDLLMLEDSKDTNLIFLHGNAFDERADEIDKLMLKIA